MRELFEVPELVRVAVEDEKSGIAFYGTLAQKDWGEELQKLFSHMRDQEAYHLKRFQEMLTALGNYQPREEYSGEYMEYLRAMTNSRAFPDADAAAVSARQCATPREALAVATQFERDTLLLMQELKPLVPPEDQDIVEELSREEQGHLVALADARRTLKVLQ